MSSSSAIITRIGTEDDPRMSKIVIHNGIVYLRGLTIQADDKQSTTITEQTTKILNIIDDLLLKAGTTKSKLLMANIFGDYAREIAGELKYEYNEQEEEASRKIVNEILASIDLTYLENR